MLFPYSEKEQFLQVSLLFTISFSLLLALGALSMAFASFQLGAVIFSLGMALVAGNEYMLFRKQRKLFGPKPPSASDSISSLINFVIISFVIPSTASLLLYFAFGWGERVLVIVVAGMILSAAKVLSVTARLFLAK